MHNTKQEGVSATTARSIEMLKAVIEGRTYEAVAGEFGITRTAVERRVKGIAARLSAEVGVAGLNDGGAAFVRRLRHKRDAILAALERFEPQPCCTTRQARVVSADEIDRAVHRIRGRSAQPARDVALFYILFATGARPLEIARIEVRDYLHADGSVRRESELPAEATITGKSRPLFFASSKLDDTLTAYLRVRLEGRQGLGPSSSFRGLDPESRLFLTATGNGFQITPYGEAGQHRFLCRPILETYRKLFRYADIKGATALSVRHTVVARLYDRGADEEQIGLVLGIGDRSAVRGLFPRARQTMAQLVDELI
ncbi:MAG: site-specific integrase [Burkholderiales bacterium]|nr:site-specific integrase [Burkholderiales bacterium]